MIRIDRSAVGQRASIKFNAGGQGFTAGFGIRADGELTGPALEAFWPDGLAGDTKARLTADATRHADALKLRYCSAIRGVLTAVSPVALRRCARTAPGVKAVPRDYVHGLDSEEDDPPFASPVLIADMWNDGPVWMFHGVVDIAQPEGVDRYKLEPKLKEQLGAEYVHVKKLWDGRPEVLAFFRRSAQ